MSSLQKDYIELDELKGFFNKETDCHTWQKFWDEAADNKNSLFVKLLTRYLPNGLNSGMTKKISVISLICLGILWCDGSIREKAIALFETINTPEKNDILAFDDKDIKIVFDTLFELVVKLEEFHKDEL